MRAILTRCTQAQVTVNDTVVGKLSRPGIVALIGISTDDIINDTEKRIDTMVRKIAELRILPEEKSACEINAPVLAISQFTLYGKTAKGRRPSWSEAAKSEDAEPIFNKIIEGLRKRNIEVSTGIFGAEMAVQSTNSGPFTVLVEVPGN